jgi:hypothetical protein
VVVLAVVALVLTMALLGRTTQAGVTASATTAGTFSYPASWEAVDTSNVTVVDGSGDTPAEHFVAQKGGKAKLGLVVYDAGKRPQGQVTREKIEAAINAGLQGQLDASDEKLLDMRSTSGFGCISDFAYTRRPAIVDRDNMYGYNYGYTCTAHTGAIEGEYLVAYDSTGVSHRLTVEARTSEWAAHRKAMEAVTASFRPNV